MKKLTAILLSAVLSLSCSEPKKQGNLEKLSHLPMPVLFHEMPMPQYNPENFARTLYWDFEKINRQSSCACEGVLYALAYSRFNNNARGNSEYILHNLPKPEENEIYKACKKVAEKFQYFTHAFYDSSEKHPWNCLSLTTRVERINEGETPKEIHDRENDVVYTLLGFFPDNLGEGCSSGGFASYSELPYEEYKRFQQEQKAREMLKQRLKGIYEEDGKK